MRAVAGPSGGGALSPGTGHDVLRWAVCSQ